MNILYHSRKKKKYVPSSSDESLSSSSSTESQTPPSAHTESQTPPSAHKPGHKKCKHPQSSDRHVSKHKKVEHPPPVENSSLDSEIDEESSSFSSDNESPKVKHKDTLKCKLEINEMPKSSKHQKTTSGDKDKK